MENDIRQLLLRAQLMAMYGSPVDTGNLRYNAISKHSRKDGGYVKISEQKAVYFWHLHYGARGIDKHAGYLDKIIGDIALMTSEYFQGKDNTYSRYRASFGKEKFNENRLHARFDRLEDSRLRFRNMGVSE